MTSAIHRSPALQLGAAPARRPSDRRIERSRALTRPVDRKGETYGAFESPLVEIAVMIIAAALATAIGSVLIKYLIDHYA